MRVSLGSQGCRLNQAEIDSLRDALERAGHDIVDDLSDADVYVLNTCTITQAADADTRRLLRRLGRQHPQLCFVVTGCHATAFPQQTADIPGVGLVVVNAGKENLVEALDRINKERPPIVDSQPAAGKAAFTGALKPTRAPGRARAFLKIQDGCDHRCTFCVVPHVRGRSLSLSPEALLQQIGGLVTARVPEVVLTGVHIGSYGLDLAPRVTLTSLLRRMLGQLDGTRIRLGSLDPHEVRPDLIELIRTERHTFCPHLHLPLQSGDGQVLRRMGRADTSVRVPGLVSRLCAQVPGFAIGADVIVGFPGENDASFQRTTDLIERLPLAYLHVFRYSPRAGTKAAGFPDQVDESTKRKRSRILAALSDAKRAVFALSQVGQVRRAVVLRKRLRDTGQMVALTDNYLQVRISGAARLMGRPVVVRIDEAHKGVARGAVVDSDWP